MKLQNKILFSVFPLIILPLLLLGWVAYQRLQQTAGATLDAQNATLLDQTAAQIEAFAATARANADLFAAADLLQNYMVADEEERYGLLQLPLLNLFTTYQQAYADYIEIRVVLPDGYEDARFALPELANLTEEETESAYFQRITGSSTKLNQFYLRNPDNNEPILLTARRLQFIDPAMQERRHMQEAPLRGFLLISARLEWLQRQLKQVRLGLDGGVLLANAAGEIWFHAQAERRGQRLPPALIQAMKTGDEVDWRGIVDGRELRYRGRRLAQNLWLLSVLPTAELRAETQRLGLAVAAITLGTILLTSLLLLLLLRKLLLRPIADLAAATATLAEGRLEQPLPVRSRDEFGALAGRFNQMVERLAQAQAQKDQAQADALAHREQAIANLQKADKLKDEFLANTSHELRTPLNGIIGISESLLDGVGGTLSKLQKQNLRMIAQSGRRLANLVNDILDSFKLRSGELQLQRKAVDAHSIVSLALALSQTLVMRKQVTLHNDVAKDLPPLDADENRLQQILLNLIGNAIKFTHQGEVRVGAELEANGYIRICVSDTGIGIPPEQQGRIFNAFEQGDGGTAREYGGTGLGLSVTQRLVALHGGQIGVASAPGQGSVFSFTLPSGQADADAVVSTPDTTLSAPLPENMLDSEALAEQEPSEAPTDQALFSCDADNTVHGCEVLIVDDEPVNLHVLVNYLSFYNYRLKLASSGPEALELLTEGYIPDIIILDVMMPRMTGFEVTQVIRETHPLHELPIILLTAKNQTRDIVTGLEAGANDYLVKPVSKEELLARMRTHLTVKRLKIAREAALETARLKAEFLANMSHEIRTPMNAIIGVGELLGATALSAEQRDYVATIRTGSETLLALVNDILDFSKIEAGKLTLEQVSFSLRDCVEQALELVSNAAAQKGLNLAYWMDWDVPEQVFGDPVRVRQILLNLLSNAVKFTERGEVRIGISRAESQEKDRVALHFSVEDTGIGIAKTKQSQLFQSFSQVDSSITRKYGGTGLGLAICKYLSELMGGGVGLDSQEGAGTRFFFHIQLAPEDSVAPPQWRDTDELRGHSLWFISAQSSNQHIIERLAAHWGMELRSLDWTSFLNAEMPPVKTRVLLEAPPQQETLKACLLRLQKRPVPPLLFTPLGHCAGLRSTLVCFNPPLRPARLYTALTNMEKEQNISAESESAPLSVNELRVLLTEDNAVNQKVAGLLLQKLGIKPAIANNGLEALTALEESHYDVVFMDMQMPEMDGLTATRKIRARGGDPQKPWIIAMTANAMDSDRAACFAAGMNDYVSKPIRPEQLRAALERYISY